MSSQTRRITRTGILLALTLVIQWVRMPQLFTGTAINAMLIITTCIVGVWEAVCIGCITPIVALMVGIIKPPLAPVIPFIIGSNAILVLLFHGIKKKNTYIAMITAAFIKFIFLFVATRWVLTTILPKPILQKVAITFGMIQFFTALAGGIIALVIVPFIQKYVMNEMNRKG
jgi:hypothetical protein